MHAEQRKRSGASKHAEHDVVELALYSSSVYTAFSVHFGKITQRDQEHTRSQRTTKPAHHFFFARKCGEESHVSATIVPIWAVDPHEHCFGCSLDAYSTAVRNDHVLDIGACQQLQKRGLRGSTFIEIADQSRESRCCNTSTSLLRRSLLRD